MLLASGLTPEHGQASVVHASPIFHIATHYTTKRLKMQFQPPLESATLIRRYKRFLADVQTADGELLTIHCPNTGAMTGCAEPGYTVWYSTSTNAKRKYPHTWELAYTPNQNWIVINTQRANQLAQEALGDGKIKALAGYLNCQREVKYGSENSRIDLLLSGHGEQPDCYIEVKSVTLETDGQGYFPDAVTLRGQKHLRELIAMRELGLRAALLFVVGHSGIQNVKPAAHIDPQYAELCILAKQKGVEFYALGIEVSASDLTAGLLLPVDVG